MLEPLSKYFLALSLFLFSYFFVAAQPFPCNGRPVITLHQNSPPNYSYWIGMEATGEVVFEELATFNSIYFNAVGFNRFDNYIYANQKNTDRVIRLKNDGSFEVVGEIPVVATASTGAGDCTPEGLYVYRENNVNKLLFFEVVDAFQFVGELEMYWAATSGNTGVFSARIDDIAFDPFQPGVAYSYLRNYPGAGSAPANAQGALIRINVDLNSPEAGEVSVVGFIPGDIVKHLGALFFDTEGNLYGYGSLQGMPNLFQDRLVLIDKLSGTTTLLGTGPGAAGNDGCSCPYGLVLEKTINLDTLYCNTDEVIFNVTIESRHHETIQEVMLRDTLPEGMIIQEINSSLSPLNMVPSTGIGTNVLAIDEITLEVGVSYEVEIVAAIDGLLPGVYENQAFLFNLPSSLGTFKSSDDKNDLSILDVPTPFIVLSEGFAAIQQQSIMPSNCMVSDGGVILNSLFFEAGFDYTITLFDESGNSTSFNTAADTDSSITLLGLSPGVYTIERIQDEAVDCNLFPDLTFEIYPPNHLIGVNTDNNSPICEGTPLQLTSSSNVDAQYTWSGPDGFVSTMQEPSIPISNLNQSGFYAVQAQQGFCLAQDTTYVEIKPGINLTVDDTLTVCSGSSLEVMASGNLQGATIFWTFPNEETQVSSVLNIAETNTQYIGLFHVLAQNDWCTDSTAMWLNVVSPPQIDLVPSVDYDYCHPLAFLPTIQDSTGSFEVEWFPTDGLSCSNCIFPEVLNPEHSVYTLTVTNEANCIDSAAIEVGLKLDKQIYIPNAFSPNGDNINDFFSLYPGCGVRKIIQFLVFDRWGNEVFKAENFDPHLSSPYWDGNTQGKSQNTKVFTWLLQVEFLNGSTEILTGDVQIVR